MVSTFKFIITFCTIERLTHDISSLAFDAWIITVVLNSRTQVRCDLKLYLRHYYLEHCIILNKYLIFEVRPASWVYRSVFFYSFSLWYHVIIWWSCMVGNTIISSIDDDISSQPFFINWQMNKLVVSKELITRINRVWKLLVHSPAIKKG